MFSIIRRQGTLSIKKRKKIRKRIFFIIVLLFTFFLLFAGRFLVVDEAPKAADVIVVLSGGEGRLEKAYELYQSGYARKMIVSNGLADNLWESTIRLLPRKSVILERKADSTYESAVYVKKIMKKHKYHSALIVSSDYHMRRVKYNFSRVYKDSDTKLIYVASNTTYDPKAWWLSKHNVGITISEYIKIIGNTFGIYGNDAKRKLYQYIEVFFYE
ncbi:YdcF family protein [Bacillus salipaludis]|uniref:YdcF family protein n=1 Tax=Bacillus salipaludis TaxID=2547811 RepID=A0AA90R9V6_9BACI|nr:YdcF family protein [Bacillus salipaludis]MDQ6600111.1 YdcF family protein [Bacillus salipaludis]